MADHQAVFMRPFNEFCIFFMKVNLTVSGAKNFRQQEHLRREKWGISARWISDLCKGNRIPGAIKIGSYWAIPADAEKPKDERIKSGRYIKTVRNPYKED